MPSKNLRNRGQAIVRVDSCRDGELPRLAVECAAVFSDFRHSWRLKNAALDGRIRIFSLQALAENLGIPRRSVGRIHKPLTSPKSQPGNHCLGNSFWCIDVEIRPAAERVIAGRIEFSVLHGNLLDWLTGISCAGGHAGMDMRLERFSAADN